MLFVDPEVTAVLGDGLTRAELADRLEAREASRFVPLRLSPYTAPAAYPKNLGPDLPPTPTGSLQDATLPVELRPYTIQSRTGNHRPFPGLEPGDTLLRFDATGTETVKVTSTGFVWRGLYFRSLSRVAREIMGYGISPKRCFALGRNTALHRRGVCLIEARPKRQHRRKSAPQRSE